MGGKGKQWKRWNGKGERRKRKANCVNVALTASEMEQLGGSLSSTRHRADGHGRPWTLMDAAFGTSFTLYDNSSV